MKILSVVLSLCLSLSLYADDYGWKKINFTSNEGTIFSLDVNVKSYQYSLGKIYNADIWVHVSDYMVTEVKVVVLNYLATEANPLVVKEFDLVHNPDKGVFEAPVPYGLTLNSIDSNYNARWTRQEIAIRVNGHLWIKDPMTKNSNFTFNIPATLGLR